MSWTMRLGTSRLASASASTSVSARLPSAVLRVRRVHTRLPDVAPPARRRLLLALGIPLTVGGGLLLLVPAEQSPVVPAILESPTVIPCPDSSQLRHSHQMSSPNEERRSITQKLIDLLLDRMWEPLCTGARFLHLVFLFAPVIITAPMIFVGQPSRKKRGGDRWGAVWWYGFLVRQMQHAGPTFIKLAQWAASRQDLFPAKLCDKMGALHSNGRPHSFAHTKRVIEAAFQRPFDEVFQEFDHTPIGTGAIAQVYRGVLNPELIPPSYLDPKPPSRRPFWRRKPRLAEAPRVLAELSNPADFQPPAVPTSAVAVKILHPRVEKTIRRDLAIMRFFATCLQVIPGIEWLSLKEEIDVFGGMMNEQLDLRHEARNLRTFEKNFAGRRGAVTFPRPLEDFSTNAVLVEEFQDAVPLKAFLRNGGGPYDHRLADLGLDAFLNMLLLDNFVHSDLHPGNIMVKFYKPTTRFVYQNILASILHTTPPTDGLSQPTPASSSPASPTFTPPSDPSTLTPSQQSDLIVQRLLPLTHDQPAFLSALDQIAAEGYQPSLVFIDTGLVTTLNATNRANFLELFRAIAQFDGYAAGSLMVERCRTPELVIQPETFALKMQHLVLGVKSKTFSLGSIRISDVLNQVLVNVREHHVKMEGDFVNTILAVLLLEGIGRQLDPEMDLFKSSLPILRQLGGQMAGTEAMRDATEGEEGWGNIAAMLKVWVWIEARELVSGAVVNIDDMVHGDWLTPNV